MGWAKCRHANRVSVAGVGAPAHSGLPEFLWCQGGISLLCEQHSTGMAATHLLGLATPQHKHKHKPHSHPMPPCFARFKPANFFGKDTMDP